MSAKVKTESDTKDTSVAIEDVHIGKGGEARTVQIGYDEVKRQLYLEVYKLGGTEVLQKFYLADGEIYVAVDLDHGNVFPTCLVTDKYPF